MTHGLCKFSMSQCLALRKQYETERSAGELAREYKTDHGTIRRAIVRSGGKMRNISEALRVLGKEKLEELIKQAEKLVKENSGKLPPYTDLPSAFRNAMGRRPEAFSQFERERRHRRGTRSGVSRRPEYQTVKAHFFYILGAHPRATYKGMPFYDNWNPDKGGSWLAGFKWIIDNIGKRPEGRSLHVVEHSKGFVPGNLEWAYPKKQTSEQMFKIIANQQNEIKRLKKKLNELGVVV